jgi:hypothetical protein
MSIFDAVALAVTVLFQSKNKQDGIKQTRD